MGKSNHKKSEKLKDSTRREKLRSNRHEVKKIIREGRLEDLDYLENEDTCIIEKED